MDFINKNYPNLGNVFNPHVVRIYLSWRWDGKIKVFYHGFVADANFFLTEHVPFFGPQKFNYQNGKRNNPRVSVDFYSVNRDFLEMVDIDPTGIWCTMTVIPLYL